MGFLSKLFGKKEEQVQELVLNSYMKGKVVEITEVPDPVFAQKMMGDGFARTRNARATMTTIRGASGATAHTMTSL